MGFPVGKKLTDLIKAWTRTEGKKDQDILTAAANPKPCWPWSTLEDLLGRVSAASDRALLSTRT
jgi:hypothetical protein